MSKRQIYLCCILITVFGWIYYKAKPLKEPRPTDSFSKAKTQNLRAWQNQNPKEQWSNYSTNTKNTIDNRSIARNNIMAGSYVSPFTPSSDLENPGLKYSAQKIEFQNFISGNYSSPFEQSSNSENLNVNYSAQKIESQTTATVVTYALNNPNNNTTSSQFTCPAVTPFAQSYTLVKPLQNAHVSARAYRNYCVHGGGGLAFADILYGDDQHVDPSFGEANNASAFVPVNTPEGCTVAENNVFLDTLVPESTIQVTPIYANTNSSRHVIGYKQTQQVQPNCIKICNDLIKTYCNTLDQPLEYCENIIINAYLKKSTYLARNIAENFCACSISQKDWGSYSFTNVVDIGNLINYSNPLKTVTCSN